MTYDKLINAIEQVINNEHIDLKRKPAMIRTLITEFRQMQGEKSIKQIVAEYYGIHPDMMNQKTRAASIVEPRKVAMYLYRKHTNLSLQEIGKLFKGENNRVFDHSTAFHAFSTISDRIRIEKAFKSKINDIELLINQLKQVA